MRLHMARLRGQLMETLRAHLVSGERPRVPDAGVPLWQAFAVLCDGRGVGAAGPEPLRPSEVEAWARLNGISLRPDHAAIIAAMDGIWLEWARKPEADRGGAAPLTGEAWDAMFG